MEDTQTTPSTMSPRKSSTGFLHLPYELRLMIYHYYIPHKCQIRLTIAPHIGKRAIISIDNAHLLEHPFHNIFRVSRQVSEEALNMLYGENLLIHTWDLRTSFQTEGRNDPHLSVLTDRNRARIRSQLHEICWCSDERVFHGPLEHIDCDLRIYCELDMLIRPGWIRLCASLMDDNRDYHDIRAASNLIWKEMFIKLGLIFEKMVPPQLTSTEIFVTPQLLLDEELMHCLRRLFDSYLHRGYQICELVY